MCVAYEQFDQNKILQFKQKMETLSYDSGDKSKNLNSKLRVESYYIHYERWQALKFKFQHSRFRLEKLSSRQNIKAVE